VSERFFRVKRRFGRSPAIRQEEALRVELNFVKLCEMAKPNFIELPGYEPVSVSSLDSKRKMG